ncbi:UDP-N-acetylmuramoylalanine--D-glutamate ligase [Arcanobacterium pluranimalium]|uniref:UDP-N-acetylmuramoyl-L-alanine--D-glutamate ligase n=1 Tax=Arcanobacterium pluranimalium TaxID=108028 RepID=UPI001EF82B1B|nr:UDP-N-acetylmuramoyl-L-alanine--D-glutamate ligase [Arcanobacterium pluranimalium]MBM7825596.1 UDP-N-acetylmuramoylalanine--D-glutamate ligase [Arcanobacterium pluranimalium]
MAFTTMSYSIPTVKDFDARRIAVLGLGVSGRACVDALVTKTRAVVGVWDSQPEAVATYSADSRISYAFSDSAAQKMLDSLVTWQPDVVVISPGFPETGIEWTTLRERNIEIWSEIELAWRLRACDEAGVFAPWLCVTGTNGKTTTVSMLASILQHSHFKGVAVGNIGTPAVQEVSRTDANAPRAFAVELSSFQLKATHSMAPAAALCLNIDDDHLEWHGTRQAYWQAKASIYERTQLACVYPVGDSQVQSMVDEADVQEGARAIGVSLGIPALGQIGLVEDVAVDRAFGAHYRREATELFELGDLKGLGLEQLPAHLVKDALAAAALARSIGVDAEQVRAGLAAYRLGAHRIETVACVDGVEWIDDSKATNAHAAKASLCGRPEKSVVWIVGGLAKGARFEQLVSEVESVLGAVIVIGRDQEPWRSALSSLNVPVHYVDTDATNPMELAVEAAQRHITSQTRSVLLAPASASMDQFTSYAHRGQAFSQAVSHKIAQVQEGS